MHEHIGQLIAYTRAGHASALARLARTWEEDHRKWGRNVEEMNAP